MAHRDYCRNGLAFPRSATPADYTGSSRSTWRRESPPPLRGSAARVLAAMEAGSPLRTSDLCRNTGLSRVTVIKALKALMAPGLVEVTSEKPTDPTRQYVRLP